MLRKNSSSTRFGKRPTLQARKNSDLHAFWKGTTSVVPLSEAYARGFSRRGSPVIPQYTFTAGFTMPKKRFQQARVL
jgi:hypothetical protein